MTTEKLVAGPLRRVAERIANRIAVLLDPQQLATLGKGGRVPSTTLRYNVRQAKAAIPKIVAEELAALASLPSSPPPQLTELQKLVREWRAESALEHNKVPDERRDEEGWKVLKGCADVLEAQLVALSCKYGATLRPLASPVQGVQAQVEAKIKQWRECPCGGPCAEFADSLAEVLK